jgi:hypothetical protein
MDLLFQDFFFNRSKILVYLIWQTKAMSRCGQFVNMENVGARRCCGLNLLQQDRGSQGG